VNWIIGIGAGIFAAFWALFLLTAKADLVRE